MPRKSNGSSRKATNARRYRKRKDELPYDWTEADETFAKVYWQDHCPGCGNPLDASFHFDHVVPITDQRPNNPGTVPWNMLPLCGSCNSSKCDTPLRLWLIRKLSGLAAEVAYRRINEFLKTVRQPANIAEGIGNMPRPTTLEDARKRWPDVVSVETKLETIVRSGTALRLVNDQPQNRITILAEDLILDGNRISWRSDDGRRVHLYAAVPGELDRTVEAFAQGVEVVRSTVYVFQDEAEDPEVTGYWDGRTAEINFAVDEVDRFAVAIDYTAWPANLSEPRFGREQSSWLVS